MKLALAGEPEPQLVPITRFFDGNDDPGSIGCNLIDHPGVDEFHRVLAALANRPDVDGVWAQISELDPGDDSWPFTDTVIVAGSISTEELRQLMQSLQPDEVSEAQGYSLPSTLVSKHTRLLVVWWD